MTSSSDSKPVPLNAVKGIFLLLVFLVIFSVPEKPAQKTPQ